MLIMQEQLLRAQIELRICDDVTSPSYPLIYIEGEARQVLAIWPTLYSEETMISFFTASKGDIQWLNDDTSECVDYRENVLKILDLNDNTLILWIFRAISQFVSPTPPKIRDSKNYRELKCLVDIENVEIIDADGNVIENGFIVRDVIKYKDYYVGHYWKHLDKYIVVQKVDCDSEVLRSVWAVL